MPLNRLEISFHNVFHNVSASESSNGQLYYYYYLDKTRFHYEFVNFFGSHRSSKPGWFVYVFNDIFENVFYFFDLYRETINSNFFYFLAILVTYY